MSNKVIVHYKNTKTFYELRKNFALVVITFNDIEINFSKTFPFRLRTISKGEKWIVRKKVFIVSASFFVARKLVTVSHGI